MPELGEELARAAASGSSHVSGRTASAAMDSDAECFAGVRPPVVADTFPGYEVMRELSRGGQGIVYQAIQAHTKRLVAIKVLRGGAGASKSARLRFEREVELVARLQHPNIISIFHSGVTGDDRQFYVMDYVRGVPLQRYVQEKQQTLEDALRLFATVCDAVQLAHRHGIIHRDLKPSNILVDLDGKPHVLDFGLAKWVATPVETAISLTDDVVGTLPYMSPEQAAGGPGALDVRTDVYSLGVLLYELLTGGFPYPVAGRTADILRHIAETPAVPPSRQWNRARGIAQRSRRPVRPGECPLDAEVQTIVLQALAKERTRRYASAGELADDVRRYLAGEPIQARRDSLTYLAWARARRVLRRQPLTATVGGLVLAALATQYVAVPLVYRWTPLNDYYEAALATIPPAGPAPDFEDVRVIGLTDRTDVAELAQAAGLADVDAANRPSLRRLHGALMARLATSGLRALAWDICFAAPSEFDDDLARGFQAVRAHGADVIVSVADWKLSEAGLPALAPAILPHVKWGATTADFSGERPWSLDLVVERRDCEPMPSLALLAVASYRQPGADALLLVDSSRQTIGLRFWKPAPAAPRAKQWLEGGGVVHLTGLWALPADDEQYGLRAGDVIGHYFVTIPPDAVLRRGTLEYQDVFAASEAQLRRWLAGRMVVVADLRPDTDRYPYTDRRVVAEAYGQAAAIEALLRSAAIRTPTTTHTRTIVGLAVLAGGGAGLLLHRSRAKGMTLLIILVAAVGVASVEAYRTHQYLVNPLVPAFALVASGVCVAFARRHAQAGQVGTETREASP